MPAPTDGLRRSAIGSMVDSCVIKHPVPPREEVIDAATGRITEQAGTTVYSGRCAVFGPSGRAGSEGSEPLEIYDASVHIPSTAPAPVEGDLVTITASRDTAAVGRSFVVASVVRSSMLVARVLHCVTLAPTERHL